MHWLMIVFAVACGDKESEESCTLIDGYMDRDGDGFGSSPITGCPEDGVVVRGQDCDEADPTIHPTAEEVCDGIDNDCNGQTDEGVTTTFYADHDGDGHGGADTTDACTRPSAHTETLTDCDDSDDTVHPDAIEICDEADNNCDGQTDEGVTTTFYADADGDGFGTSADALSACEPPATADPAWVTEGTDCDDSDPAIHPGAAEVCNLKISDIDSDVLLYE